jgi:methionine sulfoxide reductase heme-binding subunit
LHADLKSQTRLLRLSLFLWAATPLVDLFLLALSGNLGTNPQETLLRSTGMCCLVLLLVTLSITPLRRLLDWTELVRLRRMLGLWAFAYAFIHLLGFWAFEHEFLWSAVLKDAFKRPFVTVGLVGFALLIPLAITSNQWSMRQLGARWKTIHQLIYAVALLGCIHFFLHRAGKNNFFDPSVALAVTVVLLGLRWRWRRPRHH